MPILPFTNALGPISTGKYWGASTAYSHIRCDINRKLHIALEKIVELQGWTYGQLGTAFPDLQLILDTNVQQTSLIFTMNSMGYMVGGLVIGFVYGRVQHLKFLGILTILNGFTSCVLPWCNVFGLFLFVRLVDGILCGMRDGGGNVKVFSCWGSKGRKYMQALHFTYALGGIVSPVVTSFFLAPRIHSPSGSLANNESFVLNHSLKFHVDVSPVTHGGSISNSSDMRLVADIISFGSFKNETVHNTVDTESDKVIYGETKVHVAFVVTGILTAISGVIYIILNRKGYDEIPPYTKQTVDLKGTAVVATKISRARFTPRQRTVFLLVLGFAVVVYSTLECKYQSFIMPFVLMQLDWTKSDGAFLISLLWAFFGIGRFTGIFISEIISPQNLLLSCLFMIVLASCGTWVASYWHINALMWVAIPFAGFAISIIFPTFMVWTQENALKIKGKMGGFFPFVGALGFLIDPLYVGILMESVSPMYFVYLCIGQSCLAVCLVLIMFRWIHSLKKQ